MGDSSPVSTVSVQNNQHFCTSDIIDESYKLNEEAEYGHLIQRDSVRVSEWRCRLIAKCDMGKLEAK